MSERDPRFYVFRDCVGTDWEAALAMLAAEPELLRVRSGIGETVLHFLVVENACGEVAKLIAQGAEVDPQNDFGQTPLMNAAGLGWLEMVQFLIGARADLRRISERGESVFSHATNSDKADVLEYLLGLLSPDEDINPFFDDSDAELALKYSPRCAALLVPRGLTRRWRD